VHATAVTATQSMYLVLSSFRSCCRGVVVATVTVEAIFDLLLWQFQKVLLEDLCSEGRRLSILPLLACVLHQKPFVHTPLYIYAWLDINQISADLSLLQHVSTVSACCFYQLRQLRCVRRSLYQDAIATLVHAFISSRVDYCCNL